MEKSPVSSIGRKVAIVAVAFAAVGSTVFGGAALANDEGDGNQNGSNGPVAIQRAEAAGAPGGGNIGGDCDLLAGPVAVSLLGDATAYACSPTGNEGGAPTSANGAANGGANGG